MRRLSCPISTALLVSTLVLAMPAKPHAQAYHVVKQTVLGGEGGWDYVTVDPDAHRIYVPRGTHVQVLDESTHKVIADIPGMRGIHGVAIVPKVNRGFVTGNACRTQGIHSSLSPVLG